MMISSVSGKRRALVDAGIDVVGMVDGADAAHRVAMVGEADMIDGVTGDVMVGPMLERRCSVRIKAVIRAALVVATLHSLRWLRSRYRKCVMMWGLWSSQAVSFSTCVTCLGFKLSNLSGNGGSKIEFNC